MADQEIKEYAGGWITEKKHTGIPGFLKATYIVVGVCTVAYLIIYLYGETTHSDRGPLVQQFNQATGTSPGFMYFVAALAAVFFAGVIAAAFREWKHKD